MKKKKVRDGLPTEPQKRFLQNTWEKHRELTMQAAEEAGVGMIMEGEALDKEGNPIKGLTRLFTTEPEKGNLQEFYRLRYVKMVALRHASGGRHASGVESA